MRYILIIKNKWTGVSYVYPSIYLTEDAAKRASTKIPQATLNNIIHVTTTP